MENKKFGLAWWNGLSARGKEAEIGPLLDKGLTSAAIMEELGLETRNRVITVRGRIKTYREANGISMANWTEQTVPRYPSAQRQEPRKQGEGTSGIMRSIQARMERKEGPVVDVPSDAVLYQVGSAPRRYGKPLSVLTRQRRDRGYQDSDTEFGGRLSPFPTPSEVSNNPNDLTRAEIHAIAVLYRD